MEAIASLLEEGDGPSPPPYKERAKKGGTVESTPPLWRDGAFWYFGQERR